MLIYDNEQAVIDSIRRHCDRKIIAAETQIKKTTERSQQGIRARAERSAYGDILWLLTDYTLRESEPNGEPV